MTKRYIISLMAANRVGIVAALSTALAELGGDLQEVSQTVMQGFFTIILAADFPEHRDPDVIVEHIKGVCGAFEVEVGLKDPSKEKPQDPPPEGIEKYFLTLTGHDTPGIIRRISARLAQERIDIEDLHAVRDKDGGFLMILELAVPTGIQIQKLQGEIEELGKAIGLSVTLQHENIFHATNDPRPVRIGVIARQQVT
ncbi:MAG: ACT domain-containing protein [Planctomycetales bacterium]